MNRMQNLPLDNAITDLCRQLVAFKDSLDAYLVHSERIGGAIPRAAQAFAGLRPRTQWPTTAIGPHSFLLRALPFVDRQRYAAGYQSVDLDPTLIVAGTYNNYSPTPGLPVSPDGVMDWSDKRVIDANGDAGKDAAVPTVAQVGNLPLYYSIEGKNRVQLFKRYRCSMKAFVKPVSFPPATAMKLIPLAPFGQFAVEHHDGEWAFLPFPDPVVDLLRAYGVAETPRQFYLGAWRQARDIRQAIVDAPMAR